MLSVKITLKTQKGSVVPSGISLRSARPGQWRVVMLSKKKPNVSYFLWRPGQKGPVCYKINKTTLKGLSFTGPCYIFI